MRVGAILEHTLLRADATPGDVERHCAEALEHGFFGVCVSPLYVALARRCVGSARTKIVSVAGFPLGTSTSALKAEEARRAVDDGAAEIDVVMAIGLAKAGDWTAVRSDIAAVRDAVRGAVLKVIVETGHFDEADVRRAARTAVDAGADFVKTSTGFGPRGASVADVRLLLEGGGPGTRVKAAGGIRTAAEARAFVHAGATRIGTSNAVAISRDFDAH
jgi:deoxyribose-phosphate aldolase